MIFNRIVRLVQWVALAASLTALDGHAQPAHAQKSPPDNTKVFTYGDIRVSNYRKSSASNRSGIIFTGPDVIIQSIDISKNANKAVPKPLQFRLMADTATYHRVTTDKKGTGVAELSGNVRYSITRKTATGVQTIEGTAGHADYDQAAARLRLTQGVRAILTDQAKLEGPARVKADAVTIHTEGAGRYEVTGEPTTNDIQFTPRRVQTVKGKPEPQPIAGTPIHLHGFPTAEIEMERSITVNGPAATADFSDPVTGEQGSLTANRIATEMDKTLNRAVAQGDVRFRYEHPEIRSNKKGNQSLTGHSDNATYEAEGSRITVSGNVVADLTDPATLLEPAHLVAGRVVAQETPAPAGSKATTRGGLRYEASGSPERTLLVFHLRPAEKRPGSTTPVKPDSAPAKPETGAAKPASAPPAGDSFKNFVIGTVTITGFDSGTFEPGKVAVFSGDQTTYRSEDKATHTASMLRSSRLTATFGDDKTLQRLVAQGNVYLTIQEPYDSGKGMQVTHGKSTRATLAIVKGEQIIEVPGPFKMDQTVENAVKPRTTVGPADDDLLTLNVTTGTVDVESPHRTASSTEPEQDIATGPQPAAPPGVLPKKRQKH